MSHRAKSRCKRITNQHFDSFARYFQSKYILILIMLSVKQTNQQKTTLSESEMKRLNNEKIHTHTNNNNHHHQL